MRILNFTKTFTIALLAVFFASCEKDKETVPVPAIEFPDGNELNVPEEGGPASIRYEISNPVGNGQMSAGSKSGWIQDIGCDNDGKITFTVTPNKGSERTALLTLEYKYGDGTIQATASVHQSEGGPSDGAPTVRLSALEIPVPGDGGPASFSYEIINPAEDGEVKCEPGEKWVHDIDCSEQGKISFAVDRNNSLKERRSDITVTYLYGEGRSVSVKAQVVQEASEYVFELELASCSGFCYEYNSLFNTVFKSINLSSGNIGTNGAYTFNFYSESPNDSCPEAGVYTLGKPGETKDHTFSSKSTVLLEVVSMEEKGKQTKLLTMSFSGGEITVDYDDNGNMIVEGVVTDEEGQTHHVIYNGPAEYQLILDSFSTLTGDYTVNLEEDNVYSEAVWVGDTYETGTHWMVWLTPANTIEGDGVQLEFVSEECRIEDGIPSGTYRASAPRAEVLYPGQYLPGYIKGSMYGTLYLGYEELMNFGVRTIKDKASAESGDLKIVNKGDGTYEISFEFEDDRGNTWDGQWSGSFDDMWRAADRASASLHKSMH